MGRAKELVLKVIPAKIANEFVKKHHYSGKVVQNSNLHFGVFLDGQLHGVMSYGSSLDKSKIIGLVKGTKWNEFLELNRMAFDSVLPRNSESRAISQSIKLIKKNAPHIKWIISFADGAQCGDGTIYRASNFVLTSIKPNRSILILPSGTTISQVTITANWRCKQLKKECEFLGIPQIYRPVSEWLKLGAKYIDGFQLRYIYFIDKSYRSRLTVPEIPFSKIDELGAGMYKGEKVTQSERHAKKTETATQ